MKGKMIYAILLAVLPEAVMSREVTIVPQPASIEPGEGSLTAGAATQIVQKHER